MDTWIPASEVIAVLNQEAPSSTPQSPQPSQHKLTRNMKRKYEEMNLQKLSEIDPKFMALEKEREEMTKVRNVEKISLGHYQIGTWYFSPFPEEYETCKELFVCEFCLKYMKLESSLLKHKVPLATHFRRNLAPRVDRQASASTKRIACKSLKWMEK